MKYEADVCIWLCILNEYDAREKREKKVKQSSKWIQLVEWYEIDLHHVQHINEYFIQSEFGNEPAICLSLELYLLFFIIFDVPTMRIICIVCTSNMRFGEWH